MRKYKEFKIGGKDGIFDISTGRDVIISRTKEGTIPLISHQHANNGIAKYIERLPNRKLFNHKDTIALADRGVFLATVQTEDFHIGTRVKALTFKSGEKSEEIRLFFAAALNKLQILFEEYLTNATDKLPELSIMLPVNEQDELDYDYMETYIRRLKEECVCGLKEEHICEFSAYLSASGLEDYNITDDEKASCIDNTIKYKKFKLGEGEERLFDIVSSKKKFNANAVHFNGKYPYVVRSSVNNGIRGYITEDEQYLNEGNTISFGQDTATIFYQAEPYFTGDKIKIMKYRGRQLTPEIACYLITVMRKAFQNFSWGQSSFNEKVLKNIEVYMPIKNDGEIDYGYITSFITVKEKQVIKDVVDWKKRIIENTEMCL